MVRTRVFRPTLLALLLALGLAVAPLPSLEARPFMPRCVTIVQPRQEEEPRGLLAFVWSWLSAMWGKDGAHVDPFG